MSIFEIIKVMEMLFDLSKSISWLVPLSLFRKMQLLCTIFELKI